LGTNWGGVARAVYRARAKIAAAPTMPRPAPAWLAAPVGLGDAVSEGVGVEVWMVNPPPMALVMAEPAAPVALVKAEPTALVTEPIAELTLSPPDWAATARQSSPLTLLAAIRKLFY
jgi:hypothetical protein